MLCDFCCTSPQPFGVFEAHQCGSSSSGITQMRARGSASVGLGGATDGHARAAAPRAAPPAAPLPAAASQGICKTEYPVL